MSRRLLVLLALLAATAVIALQSGPADDAQPVRALTRAEGRPGQSPGAGQAAASRDLAATAVPDILPLRQRASGQSAGLEPARLFAAQSWAPAPPPKPKAPPPAPPSAPPLPFQVIGKQAVGGITSVFLAHGATVIVAREGETVAGTYRVDAIRPPFMVLTYLPLNQTQQLSIGAFDP